MMGITDITTYIVGVVVIVLLPGPNSMFVLSVAARDGMRRAYRAACGVFVGDLVLMVLAAAGVASLLRAYPQLFFALKWAGAGYLAWLGLSMLYGGSEEHTSELQSLMRISYAVFCLKKNIKYRPQRLVRIHQI